MNKAPVTPTPVYLHIVLQKSRGSHMGPDEWKEAETNIETAPRKTLSDKHTFGIVNKSIRQYTQVQHLASKP